MASEYAAIMAMASPERRPGDVLWMGTQGADGDMFPGDTIEVEISGIGTLRNYVVAEE